MKRIDNFSIMGSGTNIYICFSYSIIDEDGNITKSNIKKSRQLKESDITLVESINAIRSQITIEENNA